MGLRDIESSLPPGFRFYPSDEELVCHYLYKKVINERASEETMVEVDLHTREPWELPEVARLSANQWYFFSFRDRKYATGSRTNRATKSGYWKATGKDRVVHDPSTHSIVGMRKTLVFYRGRAPNSIKTNWVMHEFRIEDLHGPPKEDWVLCRVFHKRKGTESETGRVSFGVEIHEEDAMKMACGSTSSPPQVIDAHEPLPAHDQLGRRYDQFEFEATKTSSSSCCSALQSALASVVPHEEDDDSTNPFLNLAVLHYNYLDFPPETDNTHMNMNVNVNVMMDAVDESRVDGGYCSHFLDSVDDRVSVVQQVHHCWREENFQVRQE